MEKQNPPNDDPWARPSEPEPEPAWAEEIRARRAARADKLKDVFGGVASDDGELWK